MMATLSFSSARAPPDELVPIDGTASPMLLVGPSYVVFIRLLHNSEDLAPLFAHRWNEAL